MNTAAWIFLAWGVVNGVLCYQAGKCSGWLDCSRDYTEPALAGWRESNEAWGETITSLYALVGEEGPEVAP